MIGPRRAPDSWTPERRLREALRLAWVEADDPAVVRLVVAASRGTTSEERASIALRAVQALPYRPDPTGEWLQGGAYTATHGGDCEDLAALLAVVLELAAVPARLVWLFQPSRLRDHVTCQALLGGVWVWAEPTLAAGLAENPYRAAERLATTATME